MKNRRILLPALTCLLLLGFLAALGSVGTRANADSPGTTTSMTVTDPGGTTQTTTTTPTTTNTGTATYPGTTTQSGGGSQTTTDPGGGVTTSSTTSQAPVDQASNQSNSPQGSTTTNASTPTAPCDTTQITCGNNASTEVAIVSQNCTASSDNTTLEINVQTLSGSPVNNVTIQPTTTCLNQLSITQIVEQYCVACTVIVVPPPPPPPAVVYVPQDGPSTTIDQTTTVVEQSQQQVVVAYCLPEPVVQSDGSLSNLVYLDLNQPLTSADQGAVPATYRPGVGMICPQGASLTRAVSRVPMFTLTVPASFVHQYVRLCIESATGGKTLCHDVEIDDGATIAVPVSANVVASVVKSKALKTVKIPPPKSKKEIAKASSAFLVTLGSANSKTNKTNKKSGSTKSGAKTLAGTSGSKGSGKPGSKHHGHHSSLVAKTRKGA